MALAMARAVASIVCSRRSSAAEPRRSGRRRDGGSRASAAPPRPRTACRRWRRRRVRWRACGQGRRRSRPVPPKPSDRPFRPRDTAVARASRAAVSSRCDTRWVRRSSGSACNASRARARLSSTPPIPAEEWRWIAAPACTGIGERDQMTGEIAAVDRGDVGGLERPEVGRVVPVVEMTAIALQPLHGRKRRLDALHRLDRADPAEIAGGHGRQEVEAEVGRRRPLRDDRLGILLEIVGRQHVVPPR